MLKLVKFKIALFFAVVFLFFIGLVCSLEQGSKEIVEGKNFLEIDIENPIYVSDLVKLNPAIQAVSFVENKETMGYVNVFGGIGVDFILEQGVVYEIVAGENFTLILPYEGGWL